MDGIRKLPREAGSRKRGNRTNQKALAAKTVRNRSSFAAYQVERFAVLTDGADLPGFPDPNTNHARECTIYRRMPEAFVAKIAERGRR
jgi:hypothetical protein